MKHSAPACGRARTARPIALKSLVASLLGAGMLSHVSVAAQEAVPAPADTAVVTVSGVRKAAQSAQTIKKNADQVVDSIVADDIGKFPDKNVAEILQRVPGVQVTRGGGEAGTVIIRGLGGVVALLNGREFFSDTGRSLYLSDVPASMLQRIDVYKTQGGDLPEGGTAGVIDVRTNRPFDFKGRQVNLNARVENRDKAKTNNPDVSAMLSDRWKTGIGEIGALVGLSYQRGRYHDEVAFAGFPLPIDNGVTGAENFGRFMGNGDRKREAGNFALQWRPGPAVEVFAEGFRTNIDHRFQNNFMIGFPPHFAGATITTKPGTNNLDTITRLNQDAPGFSSTQAYQHDVTNEQVAVGARWDATPNLRLTTEVARTASYFKERRVIFDFDYTARGFVGAVRSGGGYLDFPGTNMEDPDDAKFRVRGGTDIANARQGTSNDWRGDVVYDASENGVLGFVKELSGGVRLAERKASSRGIRDMWYANSAQNGVAARRFPGLWTLSAPTGGNYGVNRYVVADHNYILDNTDVVRTILTGSPTQLEDNPLSYYSDVERTSALYAKAKFGFHMGVPISGVVGARVVRTEQTLKGNSSIVGVIAPVSVDTSRTDVLPSLALRADLTPTLVARLISGRAVERPAFVDYNPALRLTEGVAATPTTSGIVGTGVAGNPNLRPTRSDNIDVALEWYFAPTGSLTGTIFQHKFTDRSVEKAAREIVNGREYDVTRRYNLAKANLEGVEMSYRQFYDFLPGMLGGLGLEANFTYITGKQTNPDGRESAFLGMSKTSYNLVGLYEKEAWSARLAYNWRSKFTAEERYRGNDQLDLYVAPLRSLDGSLSYRINKQLTVTLDGNNLLDQPYHDYFNKDPGLVRDTRRYDRAVGLALHYKY
ncbi:TonB-dependent receptor [Massilia scottii]|uniref:TonB-dependent receptor n=1 Tax=Massilia scottii TaxID=3057166 RepID=UPI00279670B1|nr:TonB-dependent receptor [Massilia sp. CCM 9029]MDQ1833706.1 TonB-dependent receptor [Massilia sp. CCM 9029]